MGGAMNLHVGDGSDRMDRGMSLQDLGCTRLHNSVHSWPTEGHSAKPQDEESDGP